MPKTRVEEATSLLNAAVSIFYPSSPVESAKADEVGEFCAEASNIEAAHGEKTLEDAVSDYKEESAALLDDLTWCVDEYEALTKLAGKPLAEAAPRAEAVYTEKPTFPEMIESVGDSDRLYEQAQALLKELRLYLKHAKDSDGNPEYFDTNALSDVAGSQDNVTLIGEITDLYEQVTGNDATDVRKKVTQAVQDLKYRLFDDSAITAKIDAAITAPDEGAFSCFGAIHGGL
ncbi:MAG: hypothetical protein J6332_03810 [Abditibacteriota bacterium]|nr:hypothetical protein [Abditibacteriota bacterium]